FLIEAECGVERSNDLHVPHRSVRLDDAFKKDRTLHLRAHRIRCVLRLDFTKQARERDAVSGTVGAATGSAAAARPESRTAAWTVAGACAGPGSAAAARPESRTAAWTDASASAGPCSAAAARPARSARPERSARRPRRSVERTAERCQTIAAGLRHRPD